MSELKPCPFCGCTEIDDVCATVTPAPASSQDEYTIPGCSNCGARPPTNFVHNTEQAIKAWNTRASEWQSIEDAKQDGTLYEIWVEPVKYAVDFRVENGEQFESLIFGGWPHPKIGYWKQSRQDHANEMAGSSANPLYGWTVCSSAYKPTHFRPIVPPTPPAQ